MGTRLPRFLSGENGAGGSGGTGSSPGGDSGGGDEGDYIAGVGDNAAVMARNQGKMANQVVSE